MEEECTVLREEVTPAVNDVAFGVKMVPRNLTSFPSFAVVLVSSSLYQEDSEAAVHLTENEQRPVSRGRGQSHVRASSSEMLELLVSA